jgi:SsrA-binding protein
MKDNRSWPKGPSRALEGSEEGIRSLGMTLKGRNVPTKVLFNDKGRVKIEIALARGKRTYQKREVIKERDPKRELRAEFKKG